VTTADSQTLFVRASQGDALAVDRLLEQHLPGLRAYVRLRCGPALRARESASDIVQSACRDVLENIERFQWNGESGFKAWLYRTALRKIADRAEYWGAQKRDVQREVRLAAGSSPGDARLSDVYRSVGSPSGLAMGREAMERLEAAFDRLTEEEREVVVLARVVGLSHAEIGEQLGCSEGAARVRLFRALATLADVFAGEDGASP
jgi:RNA polymerase sigma-70 factor (subfamily 1)